MTSMFHGKINQGTSYSFQFTAKHHLLFHNIYINNIIFSAEFLDYLMVTKLKANVPVFGV